MRLIRLQFLALFLAIASVAIAGTRKEITLSEGWQFSRDKVEWQEVSVPHDWAISGPFDKKWDLQIVAIEQNGEKEATEKSGRSGSLPWIGEGYYKTTVNIPSGYDKAILMIDGAMSCAKVSINGKEAGYWPYGYNAFNIDATDYVNMGEDNLIEISLNNIEESSRWYPGAGIYRPIKLVLTKKANFPTWKTYTRTLSISENEAVLEVSTITDGTKGTDKSLGIEIELLDNKGHIVAASHSSQADDDTITTRLYVANPKLWSPETPYLYKLRLSLNMDRQLIDQEFINIGIRTIEVSKDGGFKLNGVTRKIKGVCLHHDLGPLGAAENKAALIRVIKNLKSMGCDAIRTAHNMPSTLHMDLCDSLGIMVMAESFDMWEYPKCRNGYAVYFKEWSDKDITNLVEHHRNHPCIIMWSIGNEIPEQWSEKGVQIAKRLQDLCHKLDPSRPVTQGMDKPDNALKSGFAQVMDVPGFNYRVHKYAGSIEKLPQGFLLGSETASTVSSRGVYKFPVVEKHSVTYDDGQCSSYDTEWCSWSNLPDDDAVWQDDYDWVIGEFVWSGYDYLGEPTPYDEYWPSRSSYFGICDLAGLPKDRYYLYRSRWNKNDHTIHLLPHWTWPGREGEVTPVYCYTDGSEAELFINGKSMGRKAKDKSSRLDRYRLRWNDVVYEPGEVRVVAYDSSGNVIGESAVRTSGEPTDMLLEAECPQASKNDRLKADGNDLAFITVSLVDKDGNFCPTTSDNLTFEVSGEGEFVAACNGDATSLQPFTEPEMKLFSGKLVVIVRSTKKAGTAILKVSDEERGLSKTISIRTV